VQRLYVGGPASKERLEAGFRWRDFDIGAQRCDERQSPWGCVAVNDAGIEIEADEEFTIAEVAEGDTDAIPKLLLLEVVGDGVERRPGLFVGALGVEVLPGLGDFGGLLVGLVGPDLEFPTEPPWLISQESRDRGKDGRRACRTRTARCGQLEGTMVISEMAVPLMCVPSPAAARTTAGLLRPRAALLSDSGSSSSAFGNAANLARMTWRLKSARTPLFEKSTSFCHFGRPVVSSMTKASCSTHGRAGGCVQIRSPAFEIPISQRIKPVVNWMQEKPRSGPRLNGRHLRHFAFGPA